MKKHFLRLFLTMITGLLSLTLSAQEVSSVTDSCITYTFTPEGDSVLSEKLITRKVDSLLHYETRTWFSWHPFYEEWRPFSKHRWIFDENGQQLLFEKYFSHGTEVWIPMTKSVAEYSDSGYKVFQASYVWENQWRGNSKSFIYQDGAGNDTLYIEMNWDPWLGKWVNFQKNRRSYDQDYPKSLYRYSWYNEEWVPFDTVEYEYIFESDGRQVTEIRRPRDVDGATWYTHRKTVWIYDDAGRLLSEVFYKAELVEWTEYIKRELQYNEDGQIIFESVMHWNTAVNDWNGEWKREFVFDSEGNEIFVYDYGWSPSNNEWYLKEREELNYAASGVLLNEKTVGGLAYDATPFVRDSTVYIQNSMGRDSVSIYWESFSADHTLDLIRKDYHFPGNKYYTTYDSICVGEVCHWRGKSFSSGGAYQDSAYTLYLKLNPLPPSFETTQIEETYFICQGQSLHYVAPENPQVEYTWWSEHGEFFSEEDNDTVFFQWLADGYGELHVRSVNDHGCMSDPVSIMVDIAICDGVEDELSACFTLYPVPLGDRLFVRTNTPYALLEVIDLKGVCHLSTRRAQQGVDLSPLPAGVYMIRLFDVDGILLGSQKIIKN